MQLNLHRSFFFFCYSTVFTNSFLIVFVCRGVEIKDTDTLFAVRRLKAWLRSSVTQIRPTHLVLVHVHQNILDTMSILKNLPHSSYRKNLSEKQLSEACENSFLLTVVFISLSNSFFFFLLKNCFAVAVLHLLQFTMSVCLASFLHRRGNECVFPVLYVLSHKGCEAFFVPKHRFCVYSVCKKAHAQAK